MRKEFDDKLVKKYPKIFADRHADMKTTAMCWGFNCEDGWYWLIDVLCETIQRYIDGNPHLKIPQVVATQVKEKWGTLNFYIAGGDELIRGMIRLTEHQSATICEVCEKEGKNTAIRNWYKTLCKKHRRKRKNYYNFFPKLVRRIKHRIWKITRKIWKKTN